MWGFLSMSSMVDFESFGSYNNEGSLEFVGVFFVMVGLLKFVSTTKMMIMVMSLEFCSIFLYFLLVIFSSISGGMVVGLYSVFLVFVVCEGVLVLVSVLGIFRKGSLMVKSLYMLKF